jgi:hypothetical protein
MNKLLITLNPDGTVKLNAREMSGSEAEILSALNDLAREVGGELVVEKHERHRHGHTHRHTHARAGRGGDHE